MKELVHKGDPVTSRVAILDHIKSGKRKTNLEHVLALVKAYPGRTANELAGNSEWLGRPIEYIEVRRRLTDLKNQNLVAQGAARPCKVRRTRMVTWYATNARQSNADRPPAQSGQTAEVPVG